MIAALEITRPHNGVLTFCSVLLGGLLVAPVVSTDLILAGTAAALVASGGYVLNDVMGLEADRINRPKRPLPSGRMRRTVAVGQAVGLLLVGLVVGVALPPPVPLLTCVAAGSLVAYNLKLQRVPMAGNLTVAGLGALAFLYGGAVSGSVRPAAVPAVFAFVYHLGREILKDAEDCAGDRRLGGSNIALRWGETTARRIGAACCAIVVLLSPIPVLLYGYGTIYLGLVAILDGLLLDVFATTVSKTSPDYRSVNRLLKLGMVLGLAAVFGDRLP